MKKNNPAIPLVILVSLALTEKHPAAMQGERNSAGAAEAKLHVTLIVLLLVFAVTASWSVQEGNQESKTNPSKQRATNPASVAVLPLAAGSPHSAALSPPSLRSLPHQGATAATSGKGQQEAFDILWKLLKIDTLHRAQEISPAEGDEAETLSGAATRVEELPCSVRVEEMLDTKGHTSVPSLKRQGPSGLTSDVADELIRVLGEEEAVEDTSSGRTRVTRAAGTQTRHFPFLLQREGLSRVDRGLFVACCR